MSSDYKYICVTHDHGYVPLVANTSRSFPHSRLIAGFVTRLTWRVSLEEQVLLSLREHLSSPPVFNGGPCYSIIRFICMFCRSLFVLLYFFFWPLCCLFFFDIRILIAPLVSSNSACQNHGCSIWTTVTVNGDHPGTYGPCFDGISTCMMIRNL
jgi:hypothetical protein